MNHEHCCRHKNLKYCEVCKVVYCADCKREWVEKCNWTFTYPQAAWVGKNETAYGTYKVGDTITTGSCSHT